MKAILRNQGESNHYFGHRVLGKQASDSPSQVPGPACSQATGTE